MTIFDIQQSTWSHDSYGSLLSPWDKHSPSGLTMVTLCLSRPSCVGSLWLLWATSYALRFTWLFIAPLCSLQHPWAHHGYPKLTTDTLKFTAANQGYPRLPWTYHAKKSWAHQWLYTANLGSSWAFTVTTLYTLESQSKPRVIVHRVAMVS